MIDVDICSTVKGRFLGKVRLSESGTVKDIKTAVAKLNRGLHVDRQSIRSTVKGKDENDGVSIVSLKIQNGSKIYVKDLGPQISWRLVFLTEYLGPILVYLYIATRPWILYGGAAPSWKFTYTAKIALLCWTAHYAKRLYETVFVHRFSHSTMPIRNLFKNCGYYWGFTAYVAYHTNHPYFMPPTIGQIIFGLVLFIVCELGNLSVHLLLRDLRPPGTTVRRIPMPNNNPLTRLFDYVSCPNYTYEYGAWLGFSIMTSCLPALFFATAGVFQMAVWAMAKHRAYKKQFGAHYPRERTAIIPHLL